VLEEGVKVDLRWMGSEGELMGGGDGEGEGGAGSGGRADVGKKDGVGGLEGADRRLGRSGAGAWREAEL
jgi:hypothetical protein